MRAARMTGSSNNCTWDLLRAGPLTGPVGTEGRHHGSGRGRAKAVSAHSPVRIRGAVSGPAASAPPAQHPQRFGDRDLLEVARLDRPQIDPVRGLAAVLRV